MSKEDFIRAHEREVAEYLAANPDADWETAYDRTADAAYIRMREDMADRIDAYRQQQKDKGL